MCSLLTPRCTCSTRFEGGVILANSTENLYGWRDNKRYIENQEFFRELEVRAVVAASQCCCRLIACPTGLRARRWHLVTEAGCSATFRCRGLVGQETKTIVTMDPTPTSSRGNSDWIDSTLKCNRQRQRLPIPTTTPSRGRHLAIVGTPAAPVLPDGGVCSRTTGWHGVCAARANNYLMSPDLQRFATADDVDNFVWRNQERIRDNEFPTYAVDDPTPYKLITELFPQVAP